MNLLNIILIGLALSFDGAAVAAANGARHKQMKVLKIMEIAVVFALFHFLMPIIGYYLGVGFKNIISGIDHWIAFALLVGLGVKMFVESLGTIEEKSVDIHDYKILFLLAVATSIDALIVGISFAFLPVHIWTASLVVGLIILIVTFASIFIGKKCGEIWGKKAEILGGLVLIGIGIKILLTHLFF